MDNQQKALELVPFTRELNVELLIINNLKKGRFCLKIDGETIGSFTDEQLKEGLNLSEFKNTPQYMQSLKVRDRLSDLWKIEAAMRGIKIIEYNSYFKAFPEKENPNALKTYLDSVFTEKYAQYGNYYKMQLEKYLINKPKEKEYELESDSLIDEIYHIAKSRKHIYSVVAL